MALQQQFSQYAGKIVDASELIKAIDEVLLEESGMIGGMLRSSFMKPAERVHIIYEDITRKIMFSGNAGTDGRLVYLDDKSGTTKAIYLDGAAVCENVSNSDLSDKNKQSIIKAVAKAKDYASDAAAGKISKWR